MGQCEAIKINTASPATPFYHRCFCWSETNGSTLPKFVWAGDYFLCLACGCSINHVGGMAVWRVDFWWAAFHHLSKKFFVPRFTSLFTPSFIPVTGLFQLIVLANQAFNIYYHLCRHEPGHTTRLSVTCDRSGYVIASSTRTLNSLLASFAQPPWPRVLLYTLTCAPKMQYTNASIDWLMRKSFIGVNPGA